MQIDNMCGIAGIARFNVKKPVIRSEIIRMTDEIIHRGPDDGGVFISKNKSVGLGNRRLSIIDLSTNGNQPMHYMNRYTIVSNNEIYNFQSERDKLIKKGYRFSSNCDTEVILALYAEYGVKCLDHMRGMFAFAIYDIHENTLFLGRDRIGKKPLKYLLSDDGIIFASELKAILRSKGVNREIDYKAIHNYLTFGYCPAPSTGFMDIKKLEPGTYLFLNLTRKTVVKKRYWEPMFNKKLDLSEKDWCKRILHTLEESTRLRMISDVPIGAFLSGGVDSSGVVALMAQLSTKPIKTFTIGFKDKNWDESAYAGNIAKMYKTDHHVLTVQPQSIEILPFLAKQFEEPFADASSVVTYMVSEMTRKYVEVALNGDGGDENFAGYPNRYLRLKRDVDYNDWIQNIRPSASSALKFLSKMTGNRSLNRADRFFDKASLPLYQRFASYNTIFNNQDLMNNSSGKLSEAIAQNNPYQIVNDCFLGFKGNDLKDAGLKFDLMYFLPDQLLSKVDIATMAVSLEARSPLLDHKFIELACQIPFALKVKNGVSKYILKKSLEGLVPKTNLYRKKMGFNIPLHKWFNGKLNEYSSNILLSKNSLIKEIIDPKYIKEMANSDNLREDFGPRIWTLMALELWMQAYFN